MQQLHFMLTKHVWIPEVLCKSLLLAAYFSLVLHRSIFYRCSAIRRISWSCKNELHVVWIHLCGQVHHGKSISHCPAQKIMSRYNSSRKIASSWSKGKKILQHEKLPTLACLPPWWCLLYMRKWIRQYRFMWGFLISAEKSEEQYLSAKKLDDSSWDGSYTL